MNVFHRFFLYFIDLYSIIVSDLVPNLNLTANEPYSSKLTMGIPCHSDNTLSYQSARPTTTWARDCINTFY